MFPIRFPSCTREMFSFSLDPEIVSFLWINSPPSLPQSDLDLALRYRLVQPSSLFHIFLYSDPSKEKVSFLNTLQYTVVTTGILVVVGISSIYTFKSLQWLRQNLDSSALQNLKSLMASLSRRAILHWRKFKEGRGPSASILRNNGANSDGSQLCKRPSDLQILASGSPRGGFNGTGRLFRSATSRETSLERRLLTKAKTPLADCDIASGEEDYNDIQGQYFGPTAQSSQFCMDLTGSSPEESPIHALSPRKTPRTTPTKRFDDPTESSC